MSDTPRTYACKTFDSIELCEQLERQLAEARENWKRVSLEAEHWLSLASKRQDEIDKLRGQLDAAERAQH